jgi:hypothetical protein
MPLTPQDFVSKIASRNECIIVSYRWNSDLSDEEILEKLLALNLERANGYVS